MLEQFKDAFSRYTPQVESVGSVGTSDSAGLSDISSRYEDTDPTDSENGGKPDKQGVLPTLPTEKGVDWEKLTV